jgi:hypothetical protein
MSRDMTARFIKQQDGSKVIVSQSQGIVGLLQDGFALNVKFNGIPNDLICLNL